MSLTHLKSYNEQNLAYKTVVSYITTPKITKIASELSIFKGLSIESLTPISLPGGKEVSIILLLLYNTKMRKSITKSRNPHKHLCRVFSL